jgi:hypothetical protein
MNHKCRGHDSSEISVRYVRCKDAYPHAAHEGRGALSQGQTTSPLAKASNSIGAGSVTNRGFLAAVMKRRDE